MSNFSQSCPRLPRSWCPLQLMEGEASRSLWMPPGSSGPGSDFSPAHHNCSKSQPEFSHRSEKSFHMFPCKNSLFMRDAVPCPRVSAPHLSKMLLEALGRQSPQSAAANVSVHMPWHQPALFRRGQHIYIDALIEQPPKSPLRCFESLKKRKKKPTQNPQI